VKKGLITVISVLICLLLAGTAFSGQVVTLKDASTHATVTDLNRDGININMGIGEIELSEILTVRGGFSLLTFNGCARSQELGEPNLPVMNRLISIPFGCELNVEVMSFETEVINLSDYNIINPLMPVQPSVSKSEDPASIPFEYNDASYTSNTNYSLPLASAEVLGTMRSVQMGLVSISPVQYNPVENIITIYKNIEVRVTYEHPDWIATQEAQTKYYSPVFDGVFNNISNYSQQTLNSRADLVEYPVQYVIISDRMFEAQLQPFIEWKTKKGFNVVVAYTDVIGSTTSQVKAYIQGLYNAGTPENPAPSFVLFVGDDQQIPSYTGFSGHISDLWMCEFTGDNYPEIYYGRFSAQNPSLLQPQIDKTLEYEQYLMPDPSYLAEVTLIAGVDGSYAITHGNGQINYGTNYYFNAAHGITDHTWLYPASNGSEVSDAVIQTVQDGIGFMNYTAHCGHDSQSDPNFNTSDIATLTNDHMYLLGIGNCCLANTFGSSYSTPSFGEAFLQKANAGAIGYIGGTNSTYWDEDYWWGVGNGPIIGAGPTYEQTGLGAYDGIFHEHGEVLSDHYITNSAIMFRGNLAVTEANSSRTAYYWQIYHLMGDPSVITYMGVPAVNNVSHPTALVFTSPTITVDADPYSYVGITVGGVLHGAGFVDETGTVEIELDPFTQPDIADIVITGQNKQPYVSTIQLFTPDGAYVVYNDNTTNDVNGNDNGIAESGENILMGVDLKNIGPDDALDVNATVTTSDPNFTMVDDTETYGTIAGGDGTLFIADGFSFDVLSSTPDGYQGTFDLEVTGTNRDLWTGNFKVQVHRPVVDFLTITINDIGNGDGVLDPGESADLIITLANSGSGQATNTTALLSESDAYVTVSDNYGTFGLIEEISGMTDNGSDVYTVSADGGCTPGHEMVFSLAVTADNGYTANLTFDFIVGDRMSFFVDDFSGDKGWIGLGGDAEWTIGPATGGTGSDGSGASDPLYDHTPTEDNGVLGNDLTSGIGGDYSNNLGTQYYVYSPVIDCGDFASSQLTYYRCLGIESSDHVKLQVFDGEDWVTLFQNTSTINETAWTEQFHNVASYADGNNSFQIRYSLGTTDNSSQYCGWNIDDFSLKGYDQSGGVSALLTLDNSEIADSMAEGGTALHSVHADNGGDGELRIRFNSEASWIVCSNDLNYVNPGEGIDFEFSFDATGMVPGDYYSTLNYTSNDFGKMAGSIPLSIHVYAPTCDIPASSIERSLSAGDSIGVPLTIYNNGPGRLIYSIGCQTFDPSEKTSNSGIVASDRELIGYQNSNDDKNDQAPLYAPSDKGHGGPDVYGYSWIDSDDPGGPIFSWVDISATGTIVDIGDDDYSDAIDIGFAFPWYDNEYTQLYIGSNGIITFGSGSSSRYNSFFPDTTSPNNMISMWWDDLDPEENGNVFYYHDVTTGRFIVSFVDIRNYQYPDGTGSLNFQAIFYPNGKVTVQYGTMDPGSDGEGLNSASIGIENAAGDDGLEVVYNAAYIHDNMAIDFTVVRWLWVEPSGGLLEPFTNAEVTVNLCAFDLEDGVFEGQMSITTNDPMNPSYLLPVTVTIQDFICGDADGNGEGPLVTDLVFLVDYIFKGGPPPPVLAAGDANGIDGDLINVADLSYLVDYLFKSGPAPICH